MLCASILRDRDERDVQSVSVSSFFYRHLSRCDVCDEFSAPLPVRTLCSRDSLESELVNVSFGNKVFLIQVSICVFSCVVIVSMYLVHFISVDIIQDKTLYITPKFTKKTMSFNSEFGWLVTKNDKYNSI